VVADLVRIYTFYMLRYLRRQLIENAEEPIRAPVEVTPEVS